MKNKLIKHAEYIHGEIQPLHNAKNFNKCYTCMSDYGEIKEMMLWFNDKQGSTHIIKESNIH